MTYEEACAKARILNGQVRVVKYHYTGTYLLMNPAQAEYLSEFGALKIYGY
jgi:hypothetical protein